MDVNCCNKDNEVFPPAETLLGMGGVVEFSAERCWFRYAALGETLNPPASNLRFREELEPQ